MTPTIASSEDTIDRDEPGGRICQKCREPFEAEDHAYREVFGKIDRTTDRGIVFGATGGIVVRHYCEECYREHRSRAKAAHYDVTDGERLWDILEAADGDLVADMLPMLVGGRAWVRVVDGDVEARHTVRERTEDGFRFDTEPTEGFDVARFGEYFDDPGDRTRVLLKPADETPFAEVDDAE